MAWTLTCCWFVASFICCGFYGTSLGPKSIVLEGWAGRWTVFALSAYFTCWVTGMLLGSNFFRNRKLGWVMKNPASSSTMHSSESFGCSITFLTSWRFCFLYEFRSFSPRCSFLSWRGSSASSKDVVIFESSLWSSLLSSLDSALGFIWIFDSSASSMSRWRLILNNLFPYMSNHEIRDFYLPWRCLLPSYRADRKLPSVVGKCPIPSN